MAVIFGFYAWQCTHCGLTGWDWLYDQKGGAYGQLATAFSEGHLYLDVVPDPKLAQVANPYLPANRLPGTTILWDYVYYKAPGDVPRYYLYFGPAPALLYLPFVVCGWMPSSLFITFVISCINVLLFCILLRYLVTRYFSSTPLYIQTLLLSAYGFCNFLPIDISAGRVYETAIVTGTTFSLGCFVFLLRSLASTGKRYGLDLFIAGVFGGLALSSKITDLFLCFVIALAWAIVQGARWNAGGKRITFGLVSGVCGVTPLLISILGLYLYNEARFGNPFESGTRFLVNEGDCLRSFFELRNVPEALVDYYLVPFNVVPAIPFIHPSYEAHLVPVDAPPFSISSLHPIDREIEDYTGMFFCFPLSMQALFWFRYALKMRDRLISIPVIIFGILISFWWIMITSVYSAFFFLGLRYETEMQMPLLMMTTISVLVNCKINDKRSLSSNLLLLLFILYGCIAHICLAYTQSQIYSQYCYY